MITCTQAKGDTKLDWEETEEIEEIRLQEKNGNAETDEVSLLGGLFSVSLVLTEPRPRFIRSQDVTKARQ